MKRAGVVAWNTFREAVRDRVLYNLLFFALDDGVIDHRWTDFNRNRRDRYRDLGFERDLPDRAPDCRFYRRGAGVQGNGEAHAVRAAGQAGAAMGIPAGKVWRAGADAGREHGGRGVRSVPGVA